MSERGSYITWRSSAVEVKAAQRCCDGCGIAADNGLKVGRGERARVGLQDEFEPIPFLEGRFLSLFYCRICAFTEHEAIALFDKVVKDRLSQFMGQYVHGS